MKQISLPFGLVMATVIASVADADICYPTFNDFFDETFDCPGAARYISEGDFTALENADPADVRACANGFHASLEENATIWAVGSDIRSSFDPRLKEKLRLKSLSDAEAWVSEGGAIYDAARAAVGTWWSKRSETAPSEGFDFEAEAEALKDGASQFYVRTAKIKDACYHDGLEWVRLVGVDAEWSMNYYRNFADYVLNHM